MLEDSDAWGLGLLDSSKEIKETEDVCDCDPDHKETQTIQESMGMNLGVFGGQIGIGDTVVICKNCHKMFPVEDTRRGNDQIW